MRDLRNVRLLCSDSNQDLPRCLKTIRALELTHLLFNFLPGSVLVGIVQLRQEIFQNANDSFIDFIASAKEENFLRIATGQTLTS